MGGMGVRFVLSSIRRGFLNIIFPAHCAVCGIPLAPGYGDRVCAACLAAVTRIRQPYCPKCGIPIKGKSVTPLDIACGECRLSSRPYGICRSAGVYSGPLKECIHSFKYRGRRELAGPLGAIMAEFADRELCSGAYDALVPVPLHRSRLRERGFNQALLLAGELGARMRRPVVSNALGRQKKTPAQSGLDKRGRLKNIKGAFMITKAESVGGMRLLLIDDVYTTGATADECVKVLRAGGAREVDIFTLARSV